MQIQSLDNSFYQIADDLPLDKKAVNVEAINRAIRQLPDGYRVVFSLYLFEGYDHQEIGQILGITEATSKSQFSRAKKKLRDLLEGQKLRIE